jgi:hypothetical protein
MTGAAESLSVERLAALLHEAEAAHKAYERQLGHRDEDWPTWYARYMLEPLRRMVVTGLR